MTLGEAKRKVLMLLDEYSAGGSLTVDEDINLKMNDFFDLAQKDANNARPIIKTTVLALTGSFVDLPGDFRAQFRNWRDGKPEKIYPVIGGRIYTKDTGSIVMEYFANPDTIDDNTPDDYEFDVEEDVANCLPYYVAAQQLIADLVVDYGAFWNMYLYHIQSLDRSEPSGGSIGVRQVLF